MQKQSGTVAVGLALGLLLLVLLPGGLLFFVLLLCGLVGAALTSDTQPTQHRPLDMPRGMSHPALHHRHHRHRNRVTVVMRKNGRKARVWRA